MKHKCSALPAPAADAKVPPRPVFTDEEGTEHTSYQRFLGYREEARNPGPDGTGTIRGAANVTLRLSEGKKYIVNPGSVGQPRDRDSWACWAIRLILAAVEARLR